MLMYVHEYLRTIIDESKRDLLHTDTDLIYLAISMNTFEECVYPHKLEEYKKLIYDKPQNSFQKDDLHKNRRKINKDHIYRKRN